MTKNFEALVNSVNQKMGILISIICIKNENKYIFMNRNLYKADICTVHNICRET